MSLTDNNRSLTGKVKGFCMAQKVYWKGLELVLRKTFHYGSRWDTQLSRSLTTEQYNCFRDVMTAIASCLALLPVNAPVD